MKIAFEKLTNFFERRNIKINGFDRLIFLINAQANIVVAHSSAYRTNPYKHSAALTLIINGIL
jgi:hypothetical protein